MKTEKPYSKHLELLYLCALAVFVAIGLFCAQKSAIFFIFSVLTVLISTSWLISQYHLQYHFFMLLAVVLPFSIEFPLNDNFNINLPSEPMLVLALLILGWEVLKKPNLLRELFSGESKWAIPLLFSFIFTVFFSSMKVISLKFSILNLSYILVFFLWQKLLFKDRPDFFPKLLILFSLSQLVVIGFSIYQLSGFDWNPVTIKGIFRPFYKDHTIFGATVAFLSVFWLLFAIKTSSIKFRLLFAALGILFLGGVFLSFSRAAFLSLIFFGFVWAALQIGVRIKHIAIGVLLVALSVVYYQDQLVQALYSNKYLSHDSNSSYVERIESSGNISTDISNLERLNRWYSGIKMAEERPFAGFGPGTYQFMYIPYQNPKLMNRLTVKNYWHIPENSGGTAHSEYVLALSEMGILGLASLLLLIGRWFWIVFEKVRIHPQRKNILIAFAVLSTYLFHGAVNNFLNIDKFAFLFWGFAAWMVANYELKSNIRKSHGHEILQ